MRVGDQNIYEFGVYRLNPATRQLLRADEPVSVTPRAFDLLVFLVSRAGEVVPKDELLSEVWRDASVEESNLSQQVFGLRRALGEDSGYIVNVPGRGYQFTALVRQGPAPLESDPPPVEKASEAPTDAQPVPEPRRIAILPAQRSRVRWLSIAGILLMLSIGAAVIFAGTQQRKHEPTYTRLVFADFGNATGDAQLDAPLEQALEVDLRQSPFLEILGDADKQNLLQQMGRTAKSPALTEEIARELCQRANSQAVVSGKVARVGSHYTLSLQANECVGGRMIAASQEEVTSEDALLHALGGLGSQLRKQLGESRQSVQQYDVPLEQATTSSLEALRAYSLALKLYSEGGDSASVLNLYQRAVDLDPNFAMAHEAMAYVLYGQDELGLAAESARKAFALSARVGEHERFAIQTHYYADVTQDLRAAIRAARDWAIAYPTDAFPYATMSDYYADLGQYPEAIDAAMKARARTGVRPLTYSVLARAERRSGHLEIVKQLGEEAGRLHCISPSFHATLWMTALMEHDAAAMAREEAWGKLNGGWFFADTLAEAAAFQGRVSDALSLMHESESKAAEGNLAETRDILLLEEVNILARFGHTREARALAAKIKRVSFGDQADLAVLQSTLGDTTLAEAMLNAPDARYSGVLMQEYELPRVRAAVALRRFQPAVAVQALEPSRPLELKDFRAISMRAQALLADNHPAEAERALQKMFANRGVDPTSLELPFGRLALARLYASQHRIADSRREYTTLLEDWANADADLKPMLAARAELAALPVS